MMGKRTRRFGSMLSAAAAAATFVTTPSLVLAQAAPGNQQRNEGFGVRGGQSGQAGQGASPQGGQGGATQVGTPPGQLKREEEARQRGKTGSAGASGAGAK